MFLKLFCVRNIISKRIHHAIHIQKYFDRKLYIFYSDFFRRFFKNFNNNDIQHCFKIHLFLVIICFLYLTDTLAYFFTICQPKCFPP